MSSIAQNKRWILRRLTSCCRRLRPFAMLAIVAGCSYYPPVGTAIAQEILSNLEATEPARPADTLPKTVTMTNSQVEVSGLRLAAPLRSPFSLSIRLTGQVSLNEDRLAHIFPIVSGQVDAVNVGLGDVVNEGDLLVVVHSREVGAAKLDLYQAKLQLELARLKLDLQQDLTNNTEKLLQALREGEEISQVQNKFTGRAMGDYRERLLQAYAAYVKSDADVKRLTGIADSGAISGKQLIAAEASRNADAATFLARIEQIEYEIKTSLLQATQLVKEAETRVAVSTANLQIMGCSAESLQNIDPIRQGESVSDYAISAPLSGTVISKDIVLREQVRPDTQILSIADLSTVWVEANVYEKDVPQLQSLKDQPIKVRNAAWPNREFQARIFFTGEIMDEATRTISMRAIADNREHLLKPGMFVTIDFDYKHSDAPVLQVPSGAVLEYGGQSFVFVKVGESDYERRDVAVGPANESMTVIEKGLVESDKVVISGGFILKSKMLEGLMGEE